MEAGQPYAVNVAPEYSELNIIGNTSEPGPLQVSGSLAVANKRGAVAVFLTNNLKHRIRLCPKPAGFYISGHELRENV